MSPTCSVAEMLGKVYYTPATVGILNVCFKVELFANGIFSVDLSNPNCANSSFQDSSVLSVCFCFTMKNYREQNIQANLL